MAEADRPPYCCSKPTGAQRFLKIHLWSPAFGTFGGGVTAFSRELARGLAGHTVRLFGQSDSVGKLDGMRIWGPGASPVGRSTRFAWGCLSAAARDKPDLVISAHVNFAPVAHLAKLLFGTRYAVVAHGIDIHGALPLARLRALKAADRIVAVSEWTKARTISLGGIASDRVSVLPNTFDETRFTPGEKPAYLLERYAIAPGERIVLTVARLSSAEGYKGYDQVVRALPQLDRADRPVRFIIAGEGDDRVRIEQIALELDVMDRVTFAGFVPEPELADHYRLADVFAMPSASEGFGIVFLEALGCGTPVVAGNLDGSVDALDNGELGKLVDPRDVGDIAAGISSILAAEGPGWWHDRQALRNAAVTRFGRVAFKSRLKNAFGLESALL